MPRSRIAVVTPAVPTRASPRKRRRIEEPPAQVSSTDDELSSLHTSSEFEEVGVKPRKTGRKKIVANVDKTVPSKTKASIKSTLQQRPRILSHESKVDLITESTGRNSKKKGKSDALLAKVNDTVKVEADEVGRTTASSVSEETILKAEDDEKPKKPIRKRKTKEEKEAEAMPLAARTAGLKMFVGAHVSIAKGLENAVTNSLHIGGNAFALFLKSQRKWDNPALKDENQNAFKQRCAHHQYDQSSHVVPHGSYLVNLASPNEEASRKSYDAFVDDLHRCEKLGIKHYNFHPGSTNKEPLDEAIGRLADNLNRALAETKTVMPLLENMAGHGSIIGSRFSDLRDIIAAIKPEYKSRIGICIDTCHTFAAGYDLRTPEAFKRTFQELDETVGLKYLKAMHINDSKAPLNSHRDLHQNIGAGFLGLRAFHNVMNDPRLQDIPLILETPCEKPDPDNPKKTIDDKNVWAREIKLLESLIGMDPESTDFKKLEADLSEQGREEREKMEQSIAKRDEKARKKVEKELEKGQKTIAAMFSNKKSKRKESVSSSSSSLSDADSDV